MRTRSRSRVVLLLVTTIACGLASRHFAAQLPDFVARYAGDVLWASMIFWWATLFSPSAHTRHLAGAAFAVCVLVEVSQLYRAPWLNELRDTTLGALVLGQGFLASDLWCYAAGVLLAAVIDWWLGSAARKQ